MPGLWVSKCAGRAERWENGRTWACRSRCGPTQLECKLPHLIHDRFRVSCLIQP